MHIERVVLQNFRSFGPEPEAVYLDATLTALIGGNGAGKTAICVGLQRLFGVTPDQRQVRVSDFHVPADEVSAPQSRTLRIEAILAFPELDTPTDDDTGGAGDTVPEFFHQMAATEDGKLKCRIALEATWVDDGSIDGDVEDQRRVIHTFDDDYGDRWSPLRGGDRSRVQMIYVPASRDGARQIGTFLRSRLWRASRWSEQLREHVTKAADELVGKFREEPVVSTIESTLANRWRQLHHADTNAMPTFEPISDDARELFRNAELMFEPSDTGRKNPAAALSDGQRSLLHLALTAAAIDIETDLIEGTHADKFELGASSLPTLTLLALEEPENHLSPFFLSRVMTQLSELSAGPRTQALLSSHSASALTRIDPMQVRHVRLDSASRTSSVTPIELPENATEAGKYIREAVRAHPELYFARHVVLCEGDSEELVIPLLAQRRGVPIERSFVAVVPLGGRHTNHFWKLLRSLRIPHSTLLDLDWGRDGGGVGRIKTACEQLRTNGVDPFDGMDGYTDIDDVAALTNTDTDEIARWMNHLRRWHIYFSQPLDLDMALLEHYFASYTTILEPGARGPKLDADAREAVLGDSGEDLDYWTGEGLAERLVWYRYLFLNKSKPATHLRVLSATPYAELAAPPPFLADLIDHLKEQLQLP